MNNKWNEIYPRPQLARGEWLGLNGEWRFRTVRGAYQAGDESWEMINVPFCPESRNSGICRRISPGEIMIYEREFTVPDEWDDRHVILNFGAVDQIANVFIDGKEAGSHKGGYLPFSIDITELLQADSDEAVTSDEADAESEDGNEMTASLDLNWEEGNEDPVSGTHTLRVEAIDELDHNYPWGKQKRDNGGMWYTPVSGIWQGVWMEPVHEEHITSLKIDCGMDYVEIRAYGIEEGTISLLGTKYLMSKDVTSGEKCASIHIDIQHPRLWTPDDPFLYTFVIETQTGDKVSSYFALRTLTVEDRDGYKRLCLNGEPFFFNGLLDQGYWQDGIYTPDSPDKFAGDIMAMKSLGFNTLRKHIKIEHEQFYYECDRLGMIVFQDMVNNGNYSFLLDSALPTIGFKNRSDKRTHKGIYRQLFLESMDETVRLLYNHPSICYWTIFNEGWGQFEADAAYDRLKEIDKSRFIDSTSGWFWQNKSDVDSYHIYFKPVDLAAGSRPLVLTEFGGYACKLPDHCFNKDKTYGYRKCENEAELLKDIAALYTKEILPLREKGLCAAIYTQLSDVEDETNGILTYDREILKFRSYTGTGRIEIIGSHTSHQGGKTIAAPSPQKIRAYVAENHSDHITITFEGSEPFDVSFTERKTYEKGSAGALVTGILEGFVDLFGPFDGEGNGFDAYITSEIVPGSGLGSSAAFELLVCRIVNDRYFEGKADPLELAKIAIFAENEYLGRTCSMLDQLAISVGRPALIDFSGKEPEIELIDLEASDYLMEIVPVETDNERISAEWESAVADMRKIAHVLGIGRLGDINEEQFKRRIHELEKKVKTGELTESQIARAQHFYDENDRVLAASVALKTGNMERFFHCINESGMSTDMILKGSIRSVTADDCLTKALDECRSADDIEAARPVTDASGVSILTFRKK